MRLTLHSLLWGTILSLSACQKDHEFGFQNYPQINFEAPQVGQQSKYLLLVGEDYKSNANFRFSYLADTLIAQIVERTENGFLVKEFLSPGSVSLNGQNHVAFADQTVYYYLLVENGALRIKNAQYRIGSRLFFFQPEMLDKLDLAENHELPLEFNGWKPSQQISSHLVKGYLENAEILGKKYTHLNVVIENRPFKTNGSGYTHIYSMKNGLVRSSQYSITSGRGFGWDLLPD